MVHRHTLVRFFVSSAYIYQNCLCNFIRMAYEFGRTIFVIHKRVLVVLWKVLEDEKKFGELNGGRGGRRTSLINFNEIHTHYNNYPHPPRVFLVSSSSSSSQKPRGNQQQQQYKLNHKTFVRFRVADETFRSSRGISLALSGRRRSSLSAEEGKGERYGNERMNVQVPKSFWPPSQFAGKTFHCYLAVGKSTGTYNPCPTAATTSTPPIPTAIQARLNGERVDKVFHGWISLEGAI